MYDAAEQLGAQGDVDHGLGHVEVALMFANEPPQTDHPAKAAPYHPTSRNDLEADCLGGAADDLDDELKERGLLLQLCAVVARIGKQVLEPWPALTDGGGGSLRSVELRG